MTDKLSGELAAIAGSKNVSVAKTELEKHAHDYSFHASSLPQIIVWPKNTKEISQILKLAHEKKISVTSYGGGTSLEGNPIPAKGGIVLNLAKMNNVLEILPKDHQVIVQSGVIGDELNAELAKQNLLFPAAPGSSHIATIGGMIANNAGGMNAVKYGVVGDWVLKLKVVLASGEIIETGSRSVKTVSGYDLKSLFIGSEGTLGIITEATLQLVSLPKDRLTFLVAFDKVGDATKATLDIMDAGIEPAAVEFMEKDYVELVNKAKPLGWHEGPSLIIELHGQKEKFDVDIAAIQTICKKRGSVAMHIADTDEARTEIWNGRKAARQNLEKVLPGCGVIPGDIGVPISKIPAFVEKVKDIGKQHDVTTFTFGHAGDGNLHIWQIYELDNPTSLARAQKVSEALVMHALQLGGTCTAEHGIGIGKRKYLAIEHASTLPLMKAVKHAFDPKGILNPDKLFLDKGKK